MSSPIGIFDSGIGGLTVLKEIVKKLPQYDYVYLGDNARAPYGSRSFETVYHYTLECVQKLFAMNCPLVILACNTASAKALRNIQQLDLPKIAPDKRVLGVIRPTTELAGKLTKSKHIGVLGTTGTVQSDSYKIEVQKFFPDVKVFARSATFKLADSSKSISNLKKLLNADVVLTGQLQQNGSVYYLSCQLVDAADQNQLWGKNMK